ncbi:MAG: hypothetical protein ACR2QA_01770 [Solirubrobacteraceae bacterium]
MTAVLSGFGLGAVLVAIAILATGGSGGTPTKWSQWVPPDRGTLGAREIADHLAPFYRLSGVDQLAVVTVVNLGRAGAGVAAGASGPSASSNPGSGGLQVAVRPGPSSSAVSILNGTTIGYNLCGIGGSDCAIDVGQPSAQRLLLLRREALELALYTFKYIGGVQNVVAILPPGHTMTQSTLTTKPPFGRPMPAAKPVDVALLFVHDQLSPLLSQPLSNTLPEQYPPSVAQMSGAPEAPLVDQLTAGGLFSERLEQAQDGSNLMVLDPLPPQ